MKKKRNIFILAFLFLLITALLPNGAYADTNVINYEKDGRVKPVKNAELLSENQLDSVLDAIGLEEENLDDMSKKEKVYMASQGGKVVDEVEVEEKSYYVSLDGTKTEYTEENEELITQKKIEDLKTYNEATGESLEIENVYPSKVKQNFGISLMAALPKDGIKTKIKGDLELTQQVIYLGSTSTQYKYSFVSNAHWNDTPLSTKTDILGSAWSEEAVAKADTFSGFWDQGKEIADGKGGTTWTFDDKKLSMKSPKAYGQYVTVSLGGGDYQNINMSREVRVGKSKKGEPAYVQTTYFHTYTNISGLSASIGPVSVDIPSKWLQSGDEIYVEYSFTFGNT
ncbi:hypothetical protein [Peribacillus frigoritolerans]|uniref:hypothetical protein n=1 Tax=Peribacillus frigoritolerans TaxID=450367 RepID=UPI0007BFEC9E|nr:hypothetical protein [Peribacillus frigoritolerans]